MNKLNFLIVALLLSSYLFTTSQADPVQKQYAEVGDAAHVDSNSSAPLIGYNVIDSSLVDIAWCGDNKSVIFVLTEKNTLYKSEDDGTTGQRLTDHLEHVAKKELGVREAVGEVAAMIQSPVDSNMLIFLGLEGVNWITEDCGKTIRTVNHPRAIEEIQFHNHERTWLLASSWTKCEEFKDGEKCRKYKELYVSKDLGVNWNLVANYVVQFAWGKVAGFRIPEERIIISHDPNGKGHQQKGGGLNEKLVVSYSDDFFQTKTELVKGGNKFLLTQHFIFVVQVNDEDKREVRLLSGSVREKSYSHLMPIEVPFKHLFEHGYTILDTSEHAVFLQINHDGDNTEYGNIYVSDSTGSRFVLSLEGNVRTSQGQCDFDRIQGLDGIYIANRYDPDQLDAFKKTEDNEAVPAQKSSRRQHGHQKDRSDAKSTKRKLQNYKETLISFDKGGMWDYLTPPSKDSEGNRIYCPDENCHLHLHSVSSGRYPPMYSTENSRGIIMGTGNIGPYLSTRSDEVNTYLSRDGGFSWSEVKKGSHIYEIGDHGAIIVMANDQKATRDIHYSFDEGKSWQSLRISDTPIEIENIIIEPSNTAENFMVYGRKSDKTEGVLIAVNFQPSLQRWCKNPENPNTPDSDYETWSPNGKISPHCLLGRKVSYIRKKQDVVCYDNEQLQTWVSIDPCMCTDEDWECDYGYLRKDIKSPCVPYDESKPSVNYTIPDECSGYYFVTQGYRKVGGDSCTNGVDHSPIRVPCPGFGSLSGSNMFVLALLVGIIVSLVWMSRKGNAERFREGVQNMVGNMMGSSNKKKDFFQLKESGSGKGSEFGRMMFDEEEGEQAEVIGDIKLEEVNETRKKTEGRGLETANKKVPAVQKPMSSEMEEFDPRK